MAVQKINNKWHVVGKIKKDDGSYYNYKKVAVNCKSKTEAKDFETDFRRQFQDIELSKKSITYAELADLMQEHDKGTKTVTKRTDKDVIDKTCKMFGDKKINLITREYLQKYINELEKEYSESYVSKIYYTTKKVFNYAVDNDMLVVNPIAKVKRSVRKDEIKEEMLFWEPSHFNQFIKVVDDKELNNLFIFLYYMGTRKGEALALQWKDIDFDKNIVSIYKSMTNKIKEKPWEITSPKNKNAIRNISMPKSVKVSLQNQLEFHKKCVGYCNECFVFGFDRPYPAETIRRKFDRYIKLANTDDNGKPLSIEKCIQRIRMHDLRHSHASYLINNMSDRFTDFDISKRLGDTVQTLHSTYAHWFKQADKGIIDFMDADAK